MCLSTTVAGAQSLSPSDARQLTSTASKATQPVVQAVKDSAPAVAKATQSVGQGVVGQAVSKAPQPVSQAAQPVSQAAQPVSQAATTGARAASNATNTASNASKAVQVPQAPALPTPVVEVPRAELRTLIAETVDAVNDAVAPAEAATDALAPAQAKPIADAVATAAVDAAAAIDDELAASPAEVVAPEVVDQVAPIAAEVAVAPVTVAASAEQPTLTHLTILDPRVITVDEPAATVQEPEVEESTVATDKPGDLVVDVSAAVDEAVEAPVRDAPTAPEATTTATTNAAVIEVNVPPMAEWDVITPVVAVAVEAAAQFSGAIDNDLPLGSPTIDDAPLSAPINNQPQSPLPALPVGGSSGGGGFSSSPSAGWLPTWIPVSVEQSWRSVHPFGRKLPSVIVLPNLAPPG